MSFKLSKKIISYSIIPLLAFVGCSVKVEQKPEITKAALQKVKWEDIKGFGQDDLKLAFDVFKKDCKGSKKYDSLKDICKKADLTNSYESFFQTNFTPYKLLSKDGSDDGLITGYYEPLLYGSYTKSEKYKYPLYTTPKDLIVIDISDAYPELKKYRLRGKLKDNKIVAYDSREEIENNPTKGLHPICYVDDKIDLFFLQIQGSGKVLLDDGEIINVGYAQQNGRKYYSIGRKLIEMGAVSKKDISLQSIRKWLNDNPDKIDQVLNLNESYVFFRESKKGATGSLGVELVPKRNLAVDRSYIPLGFPVFINTTNPIDGKPIDQLMVAADTGGAIKGEIRADLFFGYGKEAEQLAGKMKQKGKLYILIPNGI